MGSSGSSGSFAPFLETPSAAIQPFAHGTVATATAAAAAAAAAAASAAGTAVNVGGSPLASRCYHRSSLFSAASGGSARSWSGLLEPPTEDPLPDRVNQD